MSTTCAGGFGPASSAKSTFPSRGRSAGLRARRSDGSVYEMRTRARSADPLDQSVVLEMRIEKRRGDKLVAAEEHELSVRGFLRDELVMMLERAGFADVEVTGDYSGDPPHADHLFLVFAAQR